MINYYNNNSYYNNYYDYNNNPATVNKPNTPRTVQQEDNQDNPRTEQSTIHKQSKCDFEEAAESKDNHDQESQTKNIQEQKKSKLQPKKNQTRPRITIWEKNRKTNRSSDTMSGK